MGQVVAVVNQKGGVGKTTVTLGLASAARARGHRVLVVDLDPQGASTWVLGVDADLRRSVADVVASGRPDSAVRATVPSGWGHLVDVLPSSSRLQDHEALRSGLDSWLNGPPQTRLRRALEPLRAAYGVVLIDCPPSLGDLTTSALSAAGQALLVVEPSALGLRGVAPVADLIEAVWEQHNGELDLAGVVVNRMQARTADAVRHADALRRTVGSSSVWDPPIPLRVALAEAASGRRPIHATGARGRDVAVIFDALYERLWQIIRPVR